jgi:circadian clock protein KaiC
LQGAPGVGKTTLGLQYLYEGATRYNEPGLLITFEEFPASLYRDAESYGWNLRELEAQRKLRLVFTSPEILLASLQATTSPITDLLQDWNIKRVVLDSVTMFRRVTSDPVELRDIYNHLINGLKRERLTSILTSEDQMQAVSLRQQGMLGFIVDGVILMRYVEVNSAMQKAITVLKMRGINHDRMIHRFVTEKNGIKIMEPFTGLEGLLSGSSHSRGK